VKEEIEVKVLDIPRKVVEARLKDVGARLVFDGDMDALFFDFPGGSIAAARDLLRLRREGNRAMLTFKGYVWGHDPELKQFGSCPQTAKVRRETETEVSDFEAMRTILECLGLHPVRTVTKHRTTYELPGVRFAFDRHTGELAYIPEFLEIEGDDRETLERSVRLLGFAPADCRPWGLSELIAHYASDKRQVTGDK
jgi:predicted adenylyl cyclase CyaB